MGISSPLPPAGFINSSVPGNPHPTSTRPRTLSWGPTSTSPCPTVVSQVAMYPLTLPNPNPNPKPKRHSLGSDRTRTAVEFLSGELKRAFWANYDPRNYGPKPISSLRGILRRLFSILITIHRHRHPPISLFSFVHLRRDPPKFSRMKSQRHLGKCVTDSKNKRKITRRGKGRDSLAR